MQILLTIVLSLLISAVVLAKLKRNLSPRFRTRLSLAVVLALIPVLLYVVIGVARSALAYDGSCPQFLADPVSACTLFQAIERGIFLEAPFAMVFGILALPFSIIATWRSGPKAQGKS